MAEAKNPTTDPSAWDDIEIELDGEGEEELQKEEEEKKLPLETQEEEDDLEEEEENTSEQPKKKRPSHSQRLRRRIDALEEEIRSRDEILSSYNQRFSEFETEFRRGKTNDELNNIESQMARTQEEMREAVDSGDSQAIVSATKKLSELASAKGVYAMKTLENREAENRAPPKQTPQRQIPTTPRTTQNWIKENPWFSLNMPQFQELREVAIAEEGKMASEGYDWNDPDFYDELDRRLESRKTALLGGEQRMRRSGPVSPPTPSGNIRGQKPRVKMSSEDLRLADLYGIAPKDWAKEKYKVELAKGEEVEIDID